jgi:hypothetical protein
MGNHGKNVGSVMMGLIVEKTEEEHGRGKWKRTLHN